MWELKVLLIGVVLVCDVFAIRNFIQVWNNKQYDVIAIVGILLLAQNVMLIETLVSIVKFYTHSR